MATAETRRKKAEGERRKVYGLTSMCQSCKQPIRPGHTWKFTPEGGKVHYYCDQTAPNPERSGIVRYWVSPRPVARGGWLVKRVKIDESGKEVDGGVFSEEKTKAEAKRVAALANLNLAEQKGPDYGEENPSGLTFSEAMVAARQAGTRIGDTSGFEPWLVKAKLNTRSHQIRQALEEEFWKGVEHGGPAQAKQVKATHHGVKIWKDAEGWRTSFDPESLFDTYKDAKRFIDAQRKNPKLQLTDRAFRYRANANPPEGPKRCAFCWTDQQVQVGHLDGHEENSEPENLLWTCRSCNMLHANTLRSAGYGRLTRQYNPAARGAETYKQYALALMSMKGESDAMTVPAAIEMVRATSADDRSRFSREIWRLRRRHYGHTGVYRRTA